MRKRILFLLAAAIAAILILGVVIHTNTRSANNPVGIQYLPDQQKPWSESLADDTGADGIKIPGFGSLYFPADTKQIQMTLANPGDNTCYFIYTLHLDAPEGEVLYTSDAVYPGMAIYNLTLLRSLPAGAYELYIHIAPYDVETNRQLNAALLKTPLTVTNN